jgi:hypothetical protein
VFSPLVIFGGGQVKEQDISHLREGITIYERNTSHLSDKKTWPPIGLLSAHLKWPWMDYVGIFKANSSFKLIVNINLHVAYDHSNFTTLAIYTNYWKCLFQCIFPYSTVLDLKTTQLSPHWFFIFLNHNFQSYGFPWSILISAKVVKILQYFKAFVLDE